MNRNHWMVVLTVVAAFAGWMLGRMAYGASAADAFLGTLPTLPAFGWLAWQGWQAGEQNYRDQVQKIVDEHTATWERS